jgi:hypothetical protein
LGMNSVFWDVLLCVLVEMYQYFGGTAVLVFVLEDSFILRNVKKELYVIFTRVREDSFCHKYMHCYRFSYLICSTMEADSSIYVVISCKHITFRETLKMIPRAREHIHLCISIK